MTAEHLIGLLGFAFVSSITPGPNNMMLLASGANFGFRSSMPHMLGIGIGFTVMVVLVGLGLQRIFDTWPISYQVLMVLCIFYLVWLAWKIANAAPPGDMPSTARPMSFLAAAAFQWVNPKAWAMAGSAITIYAPDRTIGAVVLVAVIFGAVNLPSVSTWTILGQKLRQFLKDPIQLRRFNYTMALLLVLSMLPVMVKPFS